MQSRIIMLTELLVEVWFEKYVFFSYNGVVCTIVLDDYGTNNVEFEKNAHSATGEFQE